MPESIITIMIAKWYFSNSVIFSCISISYHITERRAFFIYVCVYYSGLMHFYIICNILYIISITLYRIHNLLLPISLKNINVMKVKKYELYQFKGTEEM